MDHVPLFVPTRSTCGGEGLVVQLGHLPSGRRVGIAFTSLARLRTASGPTQDWIRLYDDALRLILAGLGVNAVQVDPERVCLVQRDPQGEQGETKKCRSRSLA
ncbi:SAV_915 family protein [Kribbella deserti]|uniref:SAV_915 family protein n=1 Tax=Kribbella deserti TaxID=1926257 RepID=A0ABV6QGJ9_9ACTN